MTSISCGLMAWNEAKTVDLTLKSISGFADEVIIVDTGSFDGTQRIAREWMDKLDLSGQIKNIHSKSIYEMRSASIDLCTKDWVLMQDATLPLSNALKREMVEFTEKHNMFTGAVKSLNLMGDYEHYFSNRPFMAAHPILSRRDSPRTETPLRPRFNTKVITLKNYAVNLSRVRPAWRSYYRGEPFDRRYYKLGDDTQAKEVNYAVMYGLSKKHHSMVEYMETERGMTFDDVKRVAPGWYLKQLKIEATPLTQIYREALPEVIKEEQKNPRYKLIYDDGEIVGRSPEL